MVERLINCNNTVEIEFLKNLNNYKKTVNIHYQI